MRERYKKDESTKKEGVNENRGGSCRVRERANWRKKEMDVKYEERKMKREERQEKKAKARVAQIHL